MYGWYHIVVLIMSSIYIANRQPPASIVVDLPDTFKSAAALWLGAMVVLLWVGPLSRSYYATTKPS